MNYKDLIKENACSEGLIAFLDKFGTSEVDLRVVYDAAKENERYIVWLQNHFPSLDTPMEKGKIVVIMVKGNIEETRLLVCQKTVYNGSDGYDSYYFLVDTDNYPNHRGTIWDYEWLTRKNQKSSTLNDLQEYLNRLSPGIFKVLRLEK